MRKKHNHGVEGQHALTHVVQTENACGKMPMRRRMTATYRPALDIDGSNGMNRTFAGATVAATCWYFPVLKSVQKPHMSWFKTAMAVTMPHAMRKEFITMVIWEKSFGFWMSKPEYTKKQMIKFDRI